MICWRTLLFVAGMMAFPPQEPVQTPKTDGVMVAAVSRDDSMFGGGISSSSFTREGTIHVEPLAWVTASGEWKSIPCNSDHTEGCAAFEKSYVKKPHAYWVVSADGRGAVVHSPATKLGGCYEFDTLGTYAGASIAGFAIAASSTEPFGERVSPRALTGNEEVTVRKKLTSLIPSKIDSFQDLRLYEITLQKSKFIVAQRAFTDAPQRQDDSFVFLIGTLRDGRFDVLLEKKESDESERILGTIRLKSGLDFLITNENGSEEHSYRIYGIRDGRLHMVYEGGGSSC